MVVPVGILNVILIHQGHRINVFLQKIRIVVNLEYRRATPEQLSNDCSINMPTPTVRVKGPGTEKIYLVKLTCCLYADSFLAPDILTSSEANTRLSSIYFLSPISKESTR